MKFQLFTMIIISAVSLFVNKVSLSLDYVLQVSLKIQSKNIGCIDVRSPAEKGGVGETVLLWNSNEAGKGVYIKQCN